MCGTSPESITTSGSMDSGPARLRARPGMTMLRRSPPSSQTRRLRFAAKFAQKAPASRHAAAASIVGNKQQGDARCSNSTSMARRTRTRSRCSWKSPACLSSRSPVDTRKGEQFKPEFLKVNPNGKVPAIDDDGTFVFDSNAILLYLAEKTGKFLPPNTPKNRAETLSWLMFIATGLGPYSGQAVHFKHFAPKDTRLRGQPLRLRGAPPLQDPRRSSRRQEVHGRRHLQHRRHGVVGLGAAWRRSCSAKRARRSTRT